MPQVLIERLRALVSLPRWHLVTYRGVLAEGASMRPRTACSGHRRVTKGKLLTRALRMLPQRALRRVPRSPLGRVE